MKKVLSILLVLLAVAALIWGLSTTTAPSVIIVSTSPMSEALDANATAQDGQDLPAGVLSALSSVVSIQRLTNGVSKSMANSTNGLDASGVRLDNETILTAGHVVIDNGHLACRDTRVHFMRTSQAVKRAAVASNVLTHQDLATLQIARMRDKLAAAKIASTPAQKGDTVYFVNYQSLPNGQRRDTAQPAVFRGVVGSIEMNGYKIITNLDHQQNGDRLLRPGGSGGAILNEQGQLLAVSVTIDASTAIHSAASIAQKYGIGLPEGLYQLTRAQLVNKELVAELRRGMNSC